VRSAVFVQADRGRAYVRRVKASRHENQLKDPGARAIWAAILSLGEAGQHDVLGLLQERLACTTEARSPREVREARAVAALREANEIVGGAPAESAYRQVRDRERAGGRGCDWPDDRTIRRWIGPSWNDALTRAGLQAIPDADAVVVQRGSDFDREEVIAALRDCAAQLGGVPSVSRYLSWARRQTANGDADGDGDGRVPRSIGPINRLFGGWLGLLTAAGMIEGSSPTGLARSNLTRAAAGYGYTDEQMRAATREITERLGFVPRTTDYTTERERLLTEEETAGKPPRAFPSFNALNRRYGTWDAALADAGLRPFGGRHRNARPRRPPVRSKPCVSEETVLAAIRYCYREMGEPFTSSVYRRWRKQRHRQAREQGVWLRLPDYTTVLKRFGGWSTACQKALGCPSTASDDVCDDDTDRSEDSVRDAGDSG
jgi:hypothetical protein